MTASYNASAVNFLQCHGRFNNKNILFYLENAGVVHSCKFKSRRIGSWIFYITCVVVSSSFFFKFDHCFYFSGIHTNNLKKIIHNYLHCFDFPKNLIPWWDSNPGLLFFLGGRDGHCAKNCDHSIDPCNLRRKICTCLDLCM
jgi:hypothetical protein